MLKGITCSIFASISFSYMYYFSTLLMPLSGEGVFAYRVISSLPFIFGGIFVFNQKTHLISHLKRIYEKPWLLLVFLFNASITGFQMWLFLWAPNNGEALSVSVGYLLLPLALVLLGRLFLKESLSLLKTLAVILAIVGISFEIYNKGGFSWASLAVCGYAIYFALRKYFNFADISGFAIELVLLLPLCLYFAWHTDLSAVQQQNEHIVLLLCCLGVINGIAFGFYMTASNLLPINALGLLGYLEPILLLITAFLLGESISKESYPLFIALIFSIVFVLADGFSQVMKARRVIDIQTS